MKKNCCQRSCIFHRKQAQLQADILAVSCKMLSAVTPVFFTSGTVCVLPLAQYAFSPFQLSNVWWLGFACTGRRPRQGVGEEGSSALIARRSLQRPHACRSYPPFSRLLACPCACTPVWSIRGVGFWVCMPLWIIEVVAVSMKYGKVMKVPLPFSSLHAFGQYSCIIHRSSCGGFEERSMGRREGRSGWTACVISHPLGSYVEWTSSPFDFCA